MWLGLFLDRYEITCNAAFNCNTLDFVLEGGEWGPTLPEKETFKSFMMISIGSNCKFDYSFWNICPNVACALLGSLH